MTPDLSLVSHAPCYSGDSVLWCTLALLAALGLAKGTNKHLTHRCCRPTPLLFRRQCALVHTGAFG